MPAEARLEAVDSGLAPATDGWFVVNARDAAWLTNDYFGSVCLFETDYFVAHEHPDLAEVEFPQLGFSLRVLSPGQPSTMYHAETNQEAFLVLSGECVLLIEGEERTLRAWDFFHCPPGVAHGFVGAGEGPCVLLATGRRSDNAETVYQRSEVALRHGAGVETETTSGDEVYTPFGWWRRERPEGWGELPWAE